MYLALKMLWLKLHPRNREVQRKLKVLRKLKALRKKDLQRKQVYSEMDLLVKEGCLEMLQLGHLLQAYLRELLFRAESLVPLLILVNLVACLETLKLLLVHLYSLMVQLLQVVHCSEVPQLEAHCLVAPHLLLEDLYLAIVQVQQEGPCLAAITLFSAVHSLQSLKMNRNRKIMTKMMVRVALEREVTALQLTLKVTKLVLLRKLIFLKAFSPKISFRELTSLS